MGFKILFVEFNSLTLSLSIESTSGLSLATCPELDADIRPREDKVGMARNLDLLVLLVGGTLPFLTDTIGCSSFSHETDELMLVLSHELETEGTGVSKVLFFSEVIESCLAITFSEIEFTFKDLIERSPLLESFCSVFSINIGATSLEPQLLY